MTINPFNLTPRQKIDSLVEHMGLTEDDAIEMLIDMGEIEEDGEF